LRSASLEGVLHYSIYLPPGYATSGQRYSTIYFLHGLPDDGTGYQASTARDIGVAAVRTGRPVIVVAAQGAKPRDTDPEWHDWGLGRDWESATAIDLVHHIDTHYRTIPDRRARGLIGLSAGGYGASIIAFHHLDEFSVVQSWSGYFHPTNPSGTAPLKVGPGVDQQRASLHTYAREAKEIYARYHPHFDFYVGADDTRFKAENDRLHRQLTAAGVPHTYRVYPGGHDAALWDAHLDAWVRRAVARLSLPR
jgi:enterochelin esterase-like enzyme